MRHAGFFVGSQAFYRELKEMRPEELAEICMTAISFTNTLHEDETLKRAQRPHARFINTAMTVTLLGAVSSDALDDGRVVSGPGGQHDLVAMAHDLEGARSIIAVRSTRPQKRRARSNVPTPRATGPSGSRPRSGQRAAWAFCRPFRLARK